MTDAPYPPLRPQRPLRPRRHQRSPWPMIVGIVLLVFLLAVLALAVLGGDDPGTASGSESPAASSVASPSASGAPTVSSAPSASAPASTQPSASLSPGAIAPDSMVETLVDRLSVRGGPSTDAERLGSVELGTLGYVVDGPTAADGFTWYLVSGMGIPPNSGCGGPFITDPYSCPVWFGWLAGTSEGGEEWLAPYGPDCPTEPLTAESIMLGRSDLGRLACFGAEPITFRALWPEQPDEGGPDETCAAQDEPSGWLYCDRVGATSVTIDDDLGTTVAIVPAPGVSMPPRGTWVELRVHLDDPAADGCDEAAAVDGGDLAGPPEQDVLECRARMVVEAVEVVDGP